MKSTRLYEILFALDGKERLTFLEYLRSDFVKASRKEVQLLEFLLDQREDNPPEKAELWRQLYPGKAYSDQRLRLLISNLLRQLHRFLALVALEDNPGWASLLTLRKIGELGREKYFGQQIKKVQKAFLQRSDSDSELHAYLLESERTRFLRQNPRKLHSNFHQTVDALDRWYLLEKLRLACAALNNQFVVDLEAQPLIVEGIRRLYEDAPALRTPLIEVLYRVMLVFSTPEDGKGYLRLIQALEEHREDLPPQELGVIYTYVQNYCIRQINQGHSQFLRDLFEIYIQLLDRGLLLENGQLSPWHFKNMVVVALRLQEYAWTERFIRERVRLVPSAFRENARTYNQAKLHFHRGEYSEVKKLLLQVEYEDVFYNLDSKTMLLKIYYEEEEDIALEALGRSFLAYLRRNQLVSKDHRIRYSNFVRFVIRLSQLWQPSEEQLQELKSELNGPRPIADVAWLQKVVEQRLGEL